MIKLREIVGLPSLQYHIDNGLTLHENIYRYSSEAFVNLFTEAREAYENGEIELNEDDEDLIRNTELYWKNQGYKCLGIWIVWI